MTKTKGLQAAQAAAADTVEQTKQTRATAKTKETKEAVSTKTDKATGTRKKTGPTPNAQGKKLPPGNERSTEVPLELAPAPETTGGEILPAHSPATDKKKRATQKNTTPADSSAKPSPKSTPTAAPRKAKTTETKPNPASVPDVPPESTEAVPASSEPTVKKPGRKTAGKPSQKLSSAAKQSNEIASAESKKTVPEKTSSPKKDIPPSPAPSLKVDATLKIEDSNEHLFSLQTEQASREMQQQSAASNSYSPELESLSVKEDTSSQSDSLTDISKTAKKTAAKSASPRKARSASASEKEAKDKRQSALNLNEPVLSKAVSTKEQLPALKEKSALALQPQNKSLAEFHGNDVEALLQPSRISGENLSAHAPQETPSILLANGTEKIPPAKTAGQPHPQSPETLHAEQGAGWPQDTVDNFYQLPLEAFSSDDEHSAQDFEEIPVALEKTRQKGSAKKTKPDEIEAPIKNTRRKMFVSVLPEEQVEVVLTEEGQVHEYYVEMLNQAKTKGNIYKGIIHNIDPNLQAAFINYGTGKNGFLQIDEIHPEYYLHPHDPLKNHKYPPIQKVLKQGQELLVQVVKEPTGSKGAFMTTYLSLAGRFLVITPGREQIGVSRKVEDETERSRLRELLTGLNPGPGLGMIVRTVSMGASKHDLETDLTYLKRHWLDIRSRGTSDSAPCQIHQELDLAARAVRDYLTDNVVEIWLDDDTAYKSVTELVHTLFPRKKNLVRLHQEPAPLFERFNLQKQLDQIRSREVALPSGGRLVIDPTEALTAIDINSGRSGGKNNFEDMAYRTNMDAAKMIPLQLRLRDIGGQVVVDFIEMRDKSHWREVEKTLRAGMKIDRARYDVGKISAFGMLEIVRQRLGSSAISVSTEPCPHCKGTGIRRNMEWQCQQALREIARLMRFAKTNDKNEPLLFETDRDLALHLLNSKRQRLLEMEQNFGISLEIRPG